MNEKIGNFNVEMGGIKKKQMVTLELQNTKFDTKIHWVGLKAE